MRNLKRALSLSLASTMLLGMTVVGASAAADYKDADKITHKEAAAVMQSVGVMIGDDNGNFNADNKVTRAEYAVVMANLLDLDVKNYAGSSKFTDVPDWAEPYVAACYANGITSGTSATTYSPNGNVTAIQAALMMLKALGYFQYQSDFGDSWELATAKQASKADIWGDVNVSTSTELTRDQVAALALNTLKATTVDTTSTGGTTVTTPDGTVVSTGSSNYEDITSSADYAKAISKAMTDGKYTVELGEKLFDGKLKLSDSAPDSFGRNCNKWTYKTAEIGTFAKDADATYTASVKVKNIYSDLGLDKTVNPTIWVDGVERESSNSDYQALTKSLDKDLVGSGNGVLVQAYKSENATTGAAEVTLTIVKTYADTVDSVDKDEGTVTVNGMNFDTTAFSEDDVVLYTMANGDIKSMMMAQKVSEVEVTRVSGTSNFVAGGTTYKYNPTMTKLSSSDVGSVLNVYLDSYGFAVMTDVYSSSSDYAYVLGVGYDGKYTDDYTYYAKLLMADGTATEVEVKNIGTNEVDSKNYDDVKSQLVKFTKDSKDRYTLTSVSGNVATGNVKFTKGETGIQLGATSTNYYANSKTLFLVQTGTSSNPTYAAYTGYANTPSLKSASADYAVYCKTGTVATVVYVKGVSATSASDDVVYVLASKSPTVVKDSDLGTYYQYKAVVNGKVTTIDFDKQISGGKDVLFSSIVYDSDDIAQLSDCDVFSTDAKDDDYSIMFATVTDSETKDDTIGLNGAYYALNDVEVYKVVSGDKISTSSVGSIKDNYKASVVIKDGAVTSIFFSEK